MRQIILLVMALCIQMAPHVFAQNYLMDDVSLSVGFTDEQEQHVNIRLPYSYDSDNAQYRIYGIRSGTLYKYDRRVEAYKQVIREICTMPKVEAPNYDAPIQSIFEIYGISNEVLGALKTAVNTVDDYQTIYAARYEFDTSIREAFKLLKEDKRILSSHPKVANASAGLTLVNETALFVDIIYAAILNQALATEEALERFTYIKSKNLFPNDEAWQDALDLAENDLLCQSSEDYWRSLIVTLNDKKEEIAENAVTLFAVLVTHGQPGMWGLGIIKMEWAIFKGILEQEHWVQDACIAAEVYSKIYLDKDATVISLQVRYYAQVLFYDLLYRVCDKPLSWVYDLIKFSNTFEEWKAHYLERLKLSKELIEKKYSVTPISRSNGSISPNNTLSVLCGQDILFNAIPESGYEVDTWYKNGSPVQSGELTYTLTNVQDDYSIFVTFKPTISITIRSEAGLHGSINPSGTIAVEQGGNNTYYANPDSGYLVDKWYLNGQSVSGSEGWGYLTLSDIQQNASVLVTFKLVPSAGNITVTAPIAGQYAMGRIMDIGWTAVNVSGDVKIELYQDLVFQSAINPSIKASYGKDSWSVPTLDTTKSYRIKVSSLSSSAEGYSVAFTVVPTPSDGPIPIANIQDLQAIASGTVRNGRIFDRAGYYELTNDIDATETYTWNDRKGFRPIGTEATYFRGTLDGKGHSIINLWIDWESDDYVGMFRYTGDKTVIKNITFTGTPSYTHIKGKKYVGIVAGQFYGAMTNCHSSGEIRTLKSSTASAYVGGLVGENNGDIRNCSTSGPDGIIGYGDRVGGIAGVNTGKIYWCWTTMATVNASNGGILSFSSDAGGIVGENYGEIVECFSALGTNIRADYWAGGIAGHNYGMIHNCYSNSSIWKEVVGGIVGKADGGSVVNNYAIGFGSSSGGGLVGRYSGGVFDKCFWDSQASGKVSACYELDPMPSCYGKTTDEMKQRNTFTSVGWDFINIWDIRDGIGYPELRGAKLCLLAPIDVVASDGLPNKISITWNPVTDAGAYRVYRADSSDAIFNPITGWLVGSSSYQDSTGVIPNVSYYYKVKAAYTINGAGESEFSNADDGTCTFQLPQPTNITATKNLQDYVLIQWDTVSGAGYYVVYRSTSDAGTKTTISGWVEGQSFVDSTALPGIKYYYWIKAAVDSSGTGVSDYSNYDIGKVTPFNPDIYYDGKIDLLDFAVIGSNWMKEGCVEPTYCDGVDIDHSGIVDRGDVCIIAEHWLEGSKNLIDIEWLSINDPGVSGHEGFIGEISKFEITNAQYCQFLNAAMASGDIIVSDSYVIGTNGSNNGADYVDQMYYDLTGIGYTHNETINGGAARINHSGGRFTVDYGFENHPVTYISWYGAMAFCNYYGYRLPTEWEWQAVADYDGSFTYGSGTSINNNIANYGDSVHMDGTTAVGNFGTYGYGLCDMAGNVFEWTCSCLDSNDCYHIVIRGGGWYDVKIFCGVSERNHHGINAVSYGIGFRVVRSESSLVCGNGICDLGEEGRCPDCSIEPSCGDGRCDLWEEDWCPDCSIEASCGDGRCDPGEEGWCPDCSTGPFCGNTFCDPGEEGWCPDCW